MDMGARHPAGLVRCLDRWAEAQPDALLFSFHDARGNETERYTYGQFARRSAGLALALRERGLRRGERALLVHPPGLELVAALFACARVGAIGVVAPVSAPDGTLSGNAATRLRRLERDCTPSMMLGSAALGGDPAAPSSLPLLATDEIGQCADPFCEEGADILLLQYTSGSTSDPKGVMVTHANVIANAHALIDHVPVGVTWLPQFHDMGLIGYYLFPVVMGGRTHGLRPGDFLRRPDLWLQLMSAHGATYASAPNFGFAYCLQQGRIGDDALRGVDLSSLRVVLNGAEPVQAEVFRAFAERFAPFGLRPGVFRAAYGLAEATLAVTSGGTASRCFDAESLRCGTARSAPAGSQAVTELVSCGTPLAGMRVDVVDPQTGQALGAGRVGEIRLDGPSVTCGYWNRPPIEGALMTGDLGFIADGELYLCGRRGDTIIRRGQNYQPQDLEAAVVHAEVRSRGVAAYQQDDGRVVLVAEARDPNRLPDPAAIARQIVHATGLMPDQVMIVPAKTIVRTSSGKLARAATRSLLLAGGVQPLALADFSEHPTGDPATILARLEASSARSLEATHGIIGQAGLDSLSLVELQLELQGALKDAGLEGLADQLDGPALQHSPCREILDLARALRAGDLASARNRALRLLHAGQEARSCEQDAMRRDAQRPLPHLEASNRTGLAEGAGLVLTGATGFFGPFLLAHLLQLSTAQVHVLARGASDLHARDRVLAALARAAGAEFAQAQQHRLIVWQSDLATRRLGLPDGRWRELAQRTCAIFHNGAAVDYVRNYAVLRRANVEGTSSVLELAMTGAPKYLHHVSSTFIFGWTRKGVLLETDRNAEMAELDFGYSQSKWVAEQLVHRAAAAGLPVAVYRPSLISVSRSLAGDTHDVAARLLAFMIRHGVAVDTPNQISLLPVDVLAHNLVTIALQPFTQSKTYHLTADRYHSLTELTRQITRDFGFGFEYFDIPGFIARLNALASPADPVYALLDFFNRSAPHMEAMSLKRYSNTEYRRARSAAPSSLPDPSLQEVAQRLVFYLLDQGWITGASNRDSLTRHVAMYAAHANSAPAATSAR